jgi:hypothetical protein
MTSGGYDARQLPNGNNMCAFNFDLKSAVPAPSRPA